MSKKNDNQPAPLEEDTGVVEMVDDEGNVYLYTEEMIINLDDERYAILLSMPEEDSEEEPEVIIAKIVIDEKGEDLYIEPTDEEFERALAAYEAAFDEAETDE